MPLETIVAIYRRLWQIESIFKQIKQNFPLKYFYGESANAIKIQMSDTHCQSVTIGIAEQIEQALERLGTGDNYTNHTDVLPES